MTFPDRKIISGMYASGERVEDIASKVGVSSVTIYRELDRGATGALDDNQRPVYDEQLADSNAKEAMRRRGRRRIAAERAQGEA